jgi:hypothetical protein
MSQRLAGLPVMVKGAAQVMEEHGWRYVGYPETKVSEEIGFWKNGVFLPFGDVWMEWTEDPTLSRYVDADRR